MKLQRIECDVCGGVVTRPESDEPLPNCVPCQEVAVDDEVPDVLDLREGLPPHAVVPESEPIFHAEGARREFPKESVFELIHYADLRIAAEVAVAALRRGEPSVALRALEGAQPRARRVDMVAQTAGVRSNSRQVRRNNGLR